MITVAGLYIMFLAFAILFYVSLWLMYFGNKITEIKEKVLRETISLEMANNLLDILQNDYPKEIPFFDNAMKATIREQWVNKNLIRSNFWETK